MVNKDITIRDYLRKSEFPTIWCSGCGHGIVVQAAIRVIKKLGIKKDDVIVVSGIGCSSRTPAYCDFNSVQTTHGRAIAFAVGMKMQRPDINILLFLGDGDCAAIGGNHLLHAARRNIDLTVIVMNNSVYGMTGGQSSPTTPNNSITTTSPFGNIESEMNLSEVAVAAGATFVARTTAYHVVQLSSMIEQGIKNKGFSLIECMEPCPTGFGRKNKMHGAVSMYKWLRDSSVSFEKSRKMSARELEGKILTGVLVQDKKPEFIERYLDMVKQAKINNIVRENFLNILQEKAQKKKIDRIELRLAGSGGQGLILAGIILGEAAIMEGKNAVHSQSYGPEARGGASRSEVVLSDYDIDFPEVTVPDVLLAMNQKSCDKFIPLVKPGGIILIDESLVSSIPNNQARVYKYPITKTAIQEFNNKMVSNVIALGILNHITGLFSERTLEKVVMDRVPTRFRELNVEALRRGYSISKDLKKE